MNMYFVPLVCCIIIIKEAGYRVKVKVRSSKMFR